MIKIRALGSKKLQPFLKRHMQVGWSDREEGLGDFLSLALEKTNEFVPSELGLILLDNPESKNFKEKEKNKLTVVACLGKAAQKVLGRSIVAGQEILGKCYLTGEPFFIHEFSKSSKVLKSELLSTFKIKSVLFVPISIRSSRVGVICLINKKGTKSFLQKDFELIRIFSDYISASIQNFLDAKRHSEASQRDSLTTLLNDRKLLGVLKKEVLQTQKKKTNLSVLFLDLDQFKQVNDRYGHLAGSRVLVEVANLLKTNITWPRAELARYGGDEYVIVLPEATKNEALKVAEQVRLAIENFIFLKEPSKDVPAHALKNKVTASVGVASYQPEFDANQLLKAADDAMYLAKNSGKNRVSLPPVTTLKLPEAGRALRKKRIPDLNQ